MKTLTTERKRHLYNLYQSEKRNLLKEHNLLTWEDWLEHDMGYCKEDLKDIINL